MSSEVLDILGWWLGHPEHHNIVQYWSTHEGIRVPYSISKVKERLTRRTVVLEAAMSIASPTRHSFSASLFVSFQEVLRNARGKMLEAM